MATIVDWTEEQKKAWDACVAELPDSVRALCERLPPNKLYKMKSTRHRVILHSYAENGTVTVDILAKYNALDFERHVFGIDANDLEECDLPSPDEKVGAILTDTIEILAYLDLRRQTLRHPT